MASVVKGVVVGVVVRAMMAISFAVERILVLILSV